MCAQLRLRSSCSRCSIMSPRRTKTLPEWCHSQQLVGPCWAASLEKSVRCFINDFSIFFMSIRLSSNCHSFTMALVVPQLGHRLQQCPQRRPGVLSFTFGVPGNPHTADCQQHKQITNFAQDSTCALALPTYGVTHRSCAGPRPPSPTGNALLQLQAKLPRCVVRDIRSSSADLSALENAVNRFQGPPAADSPPSAVACRR